MISSFGFTSKHIYKNAGEHKRGGITMSFKYMKEFLDATDGRGGLHFEIESETISKVLSQFDLENIPDPDMDFPGFGWADQWFAVEDEQIIGIPKDMESLKRWICAFFEMYGGYPLADIMDYSGLPSLTDETRTKIAKAIESNIDEIVSDMTWCKIVSIDASHEYGWEGQKTVYEDGDFDIDDAEKEDVMDFLDHFGFDD